ncbi:hypothetical protein AWC38_SpisGene16421 [Stylophora pistillata]|uniref:Uncharacterized protein n=1 Tax=Stylophora pistillata TaxID=50429 RepID=A0A2B4RS44_STYPI|nr:hypothetical protein AWC38_SpisGene16421 [Stylophora pistillata]
MAGSILIEVFGKIAFSFTRSVMEHYHPEEPEFTIESFGLNPLESTGREWYYRPVDELIYQEYSNEETTSTNHYHYHYLAVRGINVRLINACSVEEHEEIQDEKPEERAMAWKQLRPSFMKTICKSMYIGALISLITASVIAKVLSRISVQQLWNITHPGYSYVLLVPLYFGAAVVCRLLQAELDGLLYIVVLGVIHGITEVVERSTMVLIDHFCHQLWKRKSAPWGSFRTPRRERLMADIAIISMMFESIAIVSVNGFLFFYQFIYLLNDSFSNLILSLVIYTTVPLVIEWFFTSVSLAIETRYQNMPVMAVWRWQWKRHVLVAVVNAILLSAWSSGNLLNAVSSEFIQQRPKLNRTCKM